MEPKVAAIGHIGLAVRDLDASVRFFTEVVGLTVTERFEYPKEEVGHGRLVSAAAFLRCGTTHHCIALFSLKPQEGVPESGRFGLHHIGFEMRTPGDLLRKYQGLRDANAPIINARMGGPGNMVRFYVRDPDGNTVEFYWGADEIGWQGEARAYPQIQEIDLGSFDLEQYVTERTATYGGLEDLATVHA